MNPNEKQSPSCPSLRANSMNPNEMHPPPSRHCERRRSNPEHNTMTRGGAGTIKDEKQKKDGQTAGLLRASP
ncbi:MAG: hypothetical protein RRY07_04885, partial [Bacteroidaceae bacterium]